MSTITGCASSLVRTWSDLPGDLISSILERLSIRDCVRFGAVCPSWRSALKDRVHVRAEQFPWVMIPDTGMLRTYNPGDEVYYKIDLPPQAQGRHFCMASRGWLLMISEEDYSLVLLNPISKAVIQLPKPPYPFNLWRSTVWFDPARLKLVVAIVSFEHDIAFYRVGDSEWTQCVYDLDVYDRHPLFNIVAYGSKFCCVNKSRHLLFVSFLDDNATVSVIRMDDTQLPSREPLVSYFLVESLGELLLVVTFALDGSWDAEVVPASFRLKVFRANMTTRAWEKVDDLGDRVLFVGRGASMSMSAGKIGSRGNLVYYCGKRLSWGNRYLEHYGSYWSCVEFDLENGQKRYCAPSSVVKNSFHSNFTWILPTLN
uniref:F-box/kelch-repeat protein At1g57790 n=1 Tax=Anthurium amnicola TaxID=1678845 RepID=A0A1D1YYG2_9ARAE